MKGKTIYVLGAGFSKEAGFPLISEFTDIKKIRQFRKLLSRSSQKRFDKISSYFLDRIKNNYCDDNIESVLNHVSVANYLYMESETKGTKSYSSEQISDDLLWYIVKILQERSKQKIPAIYHQFVKKIFENNDTLISFNYDLIIENILEKLSINCDYGTERTPITNSVFLMKMHGSVNWTYCKNCKKFVFYPDYAILKVLESRLKCPKCNQKNLEPIIIPPILYKDIFYKHPRYEQLIRTLWGYANDEIMAANKIVFIGFSMADSDVYAQELFKFSSNMNGNAKYELVTPIKDKKEYDRLKNRYESVLVGNTIKIHPISFSKYVKMII